MKPEERRVIDKQNYHKTTGEEGSGMLPSSIFTHKRGRCPMKKKKSSLRAKKNKM
jgi:hypothetical protein